MSDTEWEKGDLRPPSTSATDWESGDLKPPSSRSALAVANDTVIEAANAVAGGVSAAANFVKPGNAVSKFIDDKIIKAGEESQSDVVKASKKKFRDDVEGADGVGDELKAAGGYVLENPLLSAAQAAGSFVGPGAAIKGAGAAARAVGAGAKAVERAGLAGGAAAGAAMAGGDAAGTAYDLASKAGATDDQATAAGRQASVIPAVVGAAGSLVGAERLVAGAKGFGGGALARAGKTAAIEAVQEGFEEGITQYEGQRAAVPFDPTIDPTKGVAAAAGMGAALGGITGGGVSLLTGGHGGAAPAPAAAPLLLTNEPDPLVGFPDGTVGRQSEIDAYLASLPEEQRAAERARMMGLAPEAVAPAPAPDTAGAEDARRTAITRLNELNQQERGEPSVAQVAPPDGAAVLAQQRAAEEAARQAEIEASRAVTGPDDEILQSIGAADAAPLLPSQRMGLDPAAGPLSSAAVVAVDSGASQQLAEEAALQQAAEVAKEQGDAEQVGLDFSAERPGREQLVEAHAADLQERLDFLHQQGRTTGWDARLIAERDRVQAELAALAPAVAAPAPAPAPTTVKEGVAQARARRGASKGEAPAPAQGAAVPYDAAARPSAWRTNALQARKVAKSLGIDPNGLRTPQIVAAIDARDAQVQTQPQGGEDVAAARGVRVADDGARSPAGTAPDTAGRPARDTQPDGAAAARGADTGGAVSPVLEAVPDAARGSERQPALSEEAAPAAAVDAAAHEAATSPRNDTAEPTQAQKEAGNYKLGHLSGPDVQGLRISIENPQGSTRSGTSPDGTEWSNTMAAHYGYVKGTEAADGDHVDVFVGPHAATASTVYVVDQLNADGSYDEAKALLGFNTEAEAVAAYKGSYDADWKVGPITAMSVDEFKAGLAAGRFKKALSPSLQPVAKPARGVLAKMQKAKVQRETKAVRAVREAEEARATYFTPGNVVRGYGGFDRVVSYQPADGEGRWSVTVQEVRKTGSATFEDVPDADPRTHSTQPDPRAMKTGPAGRVAVPAAAAPVPQPVENGESFGELYHGTPLPFERFDADRLGKMGSGEDHQGRAVYLTSDRTGYARFFARNAVAKRANKDTSLSEEQREALYDSDGVVLRVRLSPEARIYDMRAGGQPAELQRLFGAANSDKAAGEEFRKRLMDMGYDGVAFNEPVAPEGWQTAPNATTVAVYRTELAQIQGSEAPTRPTQSDAPPASGETAPRDDRIVDFGEKIGGARKDRAEKTGTRASAAPKDDRPAWARRFEVSQIAKSRNAAEEGRWVIRDKRSLDFMKQPRQVGRDNFATREAAEAAIPLAAVSLKHRPVPTRDGKFEIWRDVTDRKRVKVVEQAFESREAALRYMAENAQAIIETNTTFGEADLPRPSSEQRVGVERRTGDVKDGDFGGTFGFRGVEFGNWNNQVDRQQLLNDAYDGLLDLAEVMGIPPRAISLDGELALAFGARGSGLSGARAHYEPAKAVINLTKMNGAGSLAHEWFHAMDHYFGRQDGKSSTEWVTDKDGTRSLQVGPAFEGEAASGGLRGERSGVRAEVREAYDGLMRTIAKKAEHYVEDTANADRFVARAREGVQQRLADIRTGLAQALDARYYKRNNKPATAEQLAEFDTVAQQILDGIALDLRLGEKTAKSRGVLAGVRWTNDALEKVSAIMKTTRGRNGFGADGNGPLDKLRVDMQLYSARLKMLADAQQGSEKTRMVPTQFVMDAKELDQGRGTDYWTTPHEMAARAFQGYVEDRIAERGGASPFLNFGPENVAIPTPWGFKRPFPHGAERVAINKALDRLVKVIQTREGEGGNVALFRRSDDGLAGLTPAVANAMRALSRPSYSPEARMQAVTGVQKTVDAIRAAWGNGPDVVVAFDMGDPVVPAAARRADLKQRSGGARGAPEGFYYRGKAYLMASRLPSAEDAARVLYHEVLGHHGLRGQFGKQLDGVLNQIATMRRAEVDAKIKEYGLRGVNKLDRRAAAEEVLAEMAQRTPELHFVRRAVAAIRAWLREHVPGFRGLRLTDDEIVRNFILPARQFVERGAGTDAPDAGPSFSRAKDDATPQRQASTFAEADDADIMFSRSKVAGYARTATAELNKTFSAPGTLSWWHKTVGTMYNLAERSPAFKPVFEAAQGFVDDVSFFANDAAELAPKLLPKLETWRDIKKSPVAAADNKAVAKPVFEGTLTWARDEQGKAVQVQSLIDAAAGLTAEQKAQRLLRNGHLDERMLKAWQGMPLESYEKAVGTRFESRMLQPGVVWSDAELRSMFNLNDGQVELYREFRDATDRSLDTMARADMLRYAGDDAKGLRGMVMDAPDAQTAAVLIRDHLVQLAGDQPDRATLLLNTANGIIDRADKVRDLQARGYAPLSRFGRFTVDAVNAAGERQYFGLFETAREANTMAARMREEFGEAGVSQGTLSEEAFKMFAGVTPETLELFGNALGLDSTGDSAQDKAFQDYLRLTKTNRSAMRRLIHRKGIAGFSEDVGRVLATFVYSNARQTAAGLHMGDLGEAVTAIPKAQGELKDAAVRLAEYVKNPQEEAQAVRGLLFAQYLGGSIASALVNALQPVQVTFPWLSQYGGAKAAAAQIGRAAKDLAARGKNFEPDLAAALKRAEAEGVVAPQEVHQLMAQARGAGTLRSGDGTQAGDLRALGQNALSRVSLAWGKVFGAAEQLNRRITFIAAYRTAKAQGIADPAGFARQAITETQFLYSKANKMEWGRGAVGGTLMTFKTYSVAYLELLHRMYTQGGPEGKRAALLALGMLMLMGGAGGLPFAEDLEDAADGLAQMMGYNFSSKKARQEFLESMLPRGIAQFIDKGVSGLPGAPLDVSGRLGMGNLIPGTGLLLEKTSHARDVLEIAGPAGDFASRILSGGRSVLTGDVGAGVLEMSPAAVRNAAKGADMAATGMYRDAKGYKVLDTGALEAAMKGIGFQPGSVATIQEANRISQGAKAFYNLRAQEIRALWAQGIFEGDAKKVQAARDQVATWNEKNPEQPMQVRIPDVMRRVREMRKSKDERIADTAPKAMRAQLKEDAARARADLGV
ncbi:PLxRFG domain-containing protein [Variovorax sp. EBFNA2]|uniref:PLxRFG domain-containing protein n=1 Tax=Variovorax sp. EBFNA2 TaxID=3342097 RepID=UPI0029BFF478|nr:PLxRFG domain-containing protein [Variovorax boronicumulans]WPG35296.1 PLxRFG domain-containing protein [Variovorax boronicumulans]